MSISFLMSTSHVYLSSFHISLLMSTSPSLLISSLCPSLVNDNDNQSALSVLSLFDEEFARYNGLGIPAQNACHLKSSGLVPALEMEICLLSLKCVAKALFAMLWEWRDVWCGVLPLLWCGERSAPKGDQHSNSSGTPRTQHESSRTQPLLERKCHVSVLARVGMCWCDCCLCVVL